MTNTQMIKIVKTLLVMTGIIFGVELIFSFPQVNDWFCSLITSSHGVWIYVVVWLIMFLQTTILNIPAYVVLSASVSIGLNTLSVVYVAVVLSAYMCGCVLAYFLGYKFGKRIIVWCAGTEEDYDKWSDVLNTKGKWWYLITVLFPFFPDDILCLVAGAVNFNFKFYFVANLIGRGVGLVTMLVTLNAISFMGGGFPLMLVMWGVLFVGELVALIILKRRQK